MLPLPHARPISEHTSSTFPVTHSILSASALLAELLPRYTVDSPNTCILLPLGVNDSYRVMTDQGQRYILRVYRAHWRSLADVLYEVEVLLHLAQRVAVSTPVSRKDGSYVTTVQAPEGPRHVILLTYAPGELPNQASVAHSYHHGRTLAEIHNGMDGFVSANVHEAIDLDYLIDRPLKAMQPLFRQRTDDWRYLLEVGARIRGAVEALPSTLDWGVCHGDPHIANAHITTNNVLTFFDFDCCGPSWRAYDLAGVRWFNKHCNLDPDDTLWHAFLNGYASVRTLVDDDLVTIPLFVAVRTIWHHALGIYTGSNRGFHQVDRFAARGLEFLRQWDFRPLHG